MAGLGSSETVFGKTKPIGREVMDFTGGDWVRPVALIDFESVPGTVSFKTLATPSFTVGAAALTVGAGALWFGR